MTVTDRRIVRVGGASAMLGDTPQAVPQLLNAGVDYLVMDYLAELTMSFLARARAKRPDAGYARYFTETIWRENVTLLAASQTKLVTNAGGLNPRACRDRMEEIAREQGVSLTIAVVDGDEIVDQLVQLADAGHLTGLDRPALPDMADVLSANVYLGAQPIVSALARGADVVITGRVVDSALALAPLMHEFGWSTSDYDRLAAGSLAGHIIECGAQATGGLYTDWELVDDWAHIGYPILECHEDGSFVVTKPDRTGGRCTAGTVSEQILYEIGDPRAYLLPDVVCDFTGVRVEQIGEHRVRVTGAAGQPPPATYKVCVTFQDGWRTIAIIPVVGLQAARKATRQAEAMLTRHAETLQRKGFSPLRASRIEVIGAESTYGRRARPLDSREVICRIGLEHDDRRAIDLFLQEVNAHTTSMAVGSTGWFAGPPSSAPVVRVASFLVDPADVPATVSLRDEEWAVSAAQGPTFEPTRAAGDAPPPPPAQPDRSGWTSVPLIRLAHGRSGDKGNAFNVGIVVRSPQYLPYVRDALTPRAVAEFFIDDFDDPQQTQVDRYDLPGISALNFVCHNALGGGQMASLRLDALGKGKAQQLLEFEIPVPQWIVAQLDV